MTATSTTLPHAFDDNPPWRAFRKALAERGGKLQLNWEVATRRDDVRGLDLRSYRVFDCQGSQVGLALVQGYGPNGFEIYPALKAGRFDDILDELDIGEPYRPTDDRAAQALGLPNASESEPDDGLDPLPAA